VSLALLLLLLLHRLMAEARGGAAGGEPREEGRATVGASRSREVADLLGAMEGEAWDASSNMSIDRDASPAGRASPALDARFAQQLRVNGRTWAPRQSVARDAGQPLPIGMQAGDASIDLEQEEPRKPSLHEVNIAPVMDRARVLRASWAGSLGTAAVFGDRVGSADDDDEDDAGAMQVEQPTMYGADDSYQYQMHSAEQFSNFLYYLLLNYGFIFLQGVPYRLADGTSPGMDDYLQREEDNNNAMHNDNEDEDGMELGADKPSDDLRRFVAFTAARLEQAQADNPGVDVLFGSMRPVAPLTDMDRDIYVFMTTTDLSEQVRPARPALLCSLALTFARTALHTGVWDAGDGGRRAPPPAA
jgi:hypothetical protein